MGTVNEAPQLKQRLAHRDEAGWHRGNRRAPADSSLSNWTTDLTEVKQNDERNQ